MIRVSVLVLLTVCSACCNVTSSSTQKEIIRPFLNVPKNMTSQAKHSIPKGYSYPKIPRQKAADCADVLEMGYNVSGVYQIWPLSTPTHRMMEGKTLSVYCDMDTNGGGWTVIQRRGDFKRPKDYFNRNWESYKKGFGNIKEDFWFGNDKIFALTNQKIYSVRFDLRDVNKDKRYAEYDEFWIDDEKRNYTLHIASYKGDAGDAMKPHNNYVFTTFDHDNPGKCAATYKGGWWYQSCHHANLNGLYYKGNHPNNQDGISWNPWKGNYESMEWTEIKIRPKHFRATFP